MSGAPFSEGEVVIHLLSYLALMQEVLAKSAIVVAVLTSIRFTFEVVIARCAFLITVGFPPVIDYLLYPPRFSFWGRVNRLKAMFPGISDTFGNVISLGLQHIRQVKLK